MSPAVGGFVSHFEYALARDRWELVIEPFIVWGLSAASVCWIGLTMWRRWYGISRS